MGSGPSTLLFLLLGHLVYDIKVSIDARTSGRGSREEVSLMAEQHQQRINEAAQQFAEALLESYRTSTDRTVSAQELNAQLTQQFFNAVMDNLRGQTENVRAASQELAEQTQRGQEAAQALTQESVAAYVDFMNSMFPTAGATGRGT